jgi:uncharacterized protein (TIGR02246 family)
VRQQVEALNLKYDEAFNQNDAEAVADLFTPDAVESGPEEAVSGQQEIQAQTPVIPTATLPRSAPSRDRRTPFPKLLEGQL